MIITIEKYKYYEEKSLIFYKEYIQLTEVIEEYSSSLPSSISLKVLVLHNKSIDIRYSKNNIDSKFIVIRNGLYLPNDKDFSIEIGSYSTILEKNGALIDEFFEIDDNINISKLI